MVFQTIVQPLQQVSKNQFGWSSSHTHDTSYPERNFVVDGKIVVDLFRSEWADAEDFIFPHTE